MDKKIPAQILGILLIVTPLFVMYAINPIAKIEAKWVDVSEQSWVIFAMLAGLGAGAFMAAEDVNKHKLVFATIFYAVALHAIMHIMHWYKMAGPDMIRSSLDIAYTVIASALALWLWKSK